MPSHGLDVKSAGSYLVHAETAGKPHCIAVVTDNAGACKVFDGDSCFTVDIGSARTCFLQALDRSHVVTFKLVPSGEAEQQRRSYKRIACWSCWLAASPVAQRRPQPTNQMKMRAT